jgi:hypothetical protein
VLIAHTQNGLEFGTTAAGALAALTRSILLLAAVQQTPKTLLAAQDKTISTPSASVCPERLIVVPNGDGTVAPQ